MKKCIVTKHALQRATERLDVSNENAYSYIQNAWKLSVSVPKKVASHLVGREILKRKGSPKFRISSSILLVCKGNIVVTLWQITPDQLADIFVWLAFGCWPDTDLKDSYP